MRMFGELASCSRDHLAREKKTLDGQLNINQVGWRAIRHRWTPTTKTHTHTQMEARRTKNPGPFKWAEGQSEAKFGTKK